MNQLPSFFTPLPAAVRHVTHLAASAVLLTFGLSPATAQEAPPLQAARADWAAGSTDVRVPERLIELLKADLQPGPAIAIGEQAYQRLGDTRWLILAMDTAQAAALPQELRRLLGLARRDEARFAGIEAYWLLTAYAAGGDGDRPAARAAFERALALNPASVATRTQMLWFDINGQDKVWLDQHLRQWQGDAASDPAFWTPYAVGLVLVDRADDSVAWYQRQVTARPDDLLWQLGYTSLLSGAGRADQAQGLRRSIYLRLKEQPDGVDHWPEAERRSLLLAQAAMARDFEGAAAGERVLQNLLARGYRDADIYSQLTASRLAQDDPAGAYKWLRRSQSAGYTLPAYLVLGVAMRRNDRAMIDQLLQTRSAELSVNDRVAALRRSGHPAQAQALVDSSLAQADEDTARALRQQREAIVLGQARRVEVRYEDRNISELNIARLELSGSQPASWGRTTLRLARNRLRPDTGSTSLTQTRDENDLAVMTELTGLSAVGDPLRLTLGTNQRSDGSLTYGGAEWFYTLSKGLRARVDLAVNALTEESAAMRAVGKKDKLTLGLSGQPSAMTYARLDVARQHFETRQGGALGRGLHVEGEVGIVLRQGPPTWQVRLSGSADRNDLEAQLPPGLAGTVLSPFATVESLLSKRFRTLGAGATLRFGSADGPGRGLNGFVDAWRGRQWPASEQAYSLRVAAALPLRLNSEVKLDGYYTNVQSGVSGGAKSSRGIALGYRHEF